MQLEASQNIAQEDWVRQMQSFMKGLVAQTRDAQLRDAVLHAMAASGKFVRSRLFYFVVESLGGVPESHVAQAASIELFHLFSLIHDDIMDEATMRRGRPSVYAEYGRDMAILAGDMVYAMSFKALANSWPSHVPHGVERFAEIAEGVCDGQALDMNFEGAHWPSVEDYLTMIRGKTAILLGWSMELGARVAGASIEIQQACFELGVRQGLVFQIQDDILDVYGQTHQTGKIHAGDIIQGKKTILTVQCESYLDEMDREVFRGLYTQMGMQVHDKIERVKTFYAQTDALAKAREIQAQLNISSNKISGDLEEAGLNLSKIRAFMDHLINRQS